MLRLRLFLVAVAVPVVLWGLLPALADSQSLSTKLDRKRGEVAAKRDRAGELSREVASYSQRIDSLGGEIDGLESRRVSLQSDLDRKLARLAGIQSKLRAERARLTRLRARLAEARVTLSSRLVDLYKADDPDLLAVALNSDGFADLLERGEFARRVGRQDSRIIRFVREAKADAVATEKRLSKLEAEAKEVAAAIEARRDEVVQTQNGLRSRQESYQRVRGQRREVLTSVRQKLKHSESDLAALEREQAKVQARLAASSGGGGGGAAAAPATSGSGRFVMPANAPLTSPFGPRWGRLHAGLDFGVPMGTPIRAADSGTARIAGPTGGYGNYICIQHSGSLSSCYAHNSSLNISVGQSVKKGQVIAQSGNTGNSTGPHLHFEVRVNGKPVDPMGYL